MKQGSVSSHNGIHLSSSQGKNQRPKIGLHGTASGDRLLEPDGRSQDLSDDGIELRTTDGIGL